MTKKINNKEIKVIMEIIRRLKNIKKLVGKLK